MTERTTHYYGDDCKPPHEQPTRHYQSGRIQGLGEAIHVLIDAGVSQEVQDVLHERIDRAYLAMGGTDREPRSRAVRAEQEMDRD